MKILGVLVLMAQTAVVQAQSSGMNRSEFDTSLGGIASRRRALR
jgi:hypothetical protein